MADQLRKITYASMGLTLACSVVALSFFQDKLYLNGPSLLKKAEQVQSISSTPVIPIAPPETADLPDFILKNAEADKTGKAQYKIAQMYKSGMRDLGQDNVMYREWLDRSVSQEYPEALYDLAILLSGSREEPKQMESLNLFARAAKQEHAGAQLELANIYFEGRLLKQDYGAAMYWYKSAANKGLADAEFNLGVMYQLGRGVSASPEKATEYYRAAAVKGHTMAQYNLGIAYYFGIGIEQDLVKAESWLRKSLEGGNLRALEILQTFKVT